MVGVVSVILIIFSLLIHDESFITGPAVFFTINLLIQLAELKKTNEVKTYIKLFVLPSFIAIIYYTNLISQNSYLNEEFLLILTLFLFNCLVLPFSQLWLHNINPFANPNTLITKAWQNIMNFLFIVLGMLFFQILTYFMSFFILNEILDKLLPFHIISMLWVFIIFWFLNHKTHLSQNLLNSFSIFLKLCLVLSCFLSITFAFITILNLSDYDFMSHELIFYQVMFSITIFLAQSQLLQSPDKKISNTDLYLFYLVFFTFLAILLSLAGLLTIFTNSYLINEIAPTIFLRLAINITLGLYVLSYLFLSIVSISYRFYSKPNTYSIASKQESTQIKMQSMDSELQAALPYQTDTTILARMLSVFRPNLALFIKRLSYFNFIFLSIFIVAGSYCLTPFFNLNAILTDRHINRLLDNQVSADQFNFGLLENTLGSEGYTKFHNLIEIAKESNYQHLKELEQKYHIYKYGEPSNEPSLEDQEKNILDYYQQFPYQNLTIRPNQNAVEQEILDKIILNSILYTRKQEQCLFNPNTPENTIMAKCFIDVIHPDIKQPDKKVYALTTIYWSERNDYHQNVAFYQYEDDTLIRVNSSELNKCDYKNRTKFVDLTDFNQNISSQIKLFNSPYYLLRRDNSVYEFPHVCE